LAGDGGDAPTSPVARLWPAATGICGDEAADDTFPLEREVSRIDLSWLDRSLEDTDGRVLVSARRFGLAWLQYARREGGVGLGMPGLAGGWTA
jgi:hypothetical protein